MKKMVQDIIIKPVISEAGMDMMSQKKYVFKCCRRKLKQSEKSGNKSVILTRNYIAF